LQDRKTFFLRALICERFVENMLAVGVAFVFQPVNPCSAISAGEGFQDARYLTESCVTCCRGPVPYQTFAPYLAGSALLYVLSWLLGWSLDTFVYCESTSKA
jgi:hypothetical protein